MRKAAPFKPEEAEISWVPAAPMPGGGREYLVTLARRDIIESYQRACEDARGRGRHRRSGVAQPDQRCAGRRHAAGDHDSVPSSGTCWSSTSRPTTRRWPSSATAI